MATGASASELAVILVDARKGVLPQTKRHAFIGRLLGIRQIVLAGNTMQTVGFERRRFDDIAEHFSAFAADLGEVSVAAIPLSARFGDNITEISARMPWYDGPTLIEHLHSVDISGDSVERPFRFPVQWVNRPDGDFRGFSGTVVSGGVGPGDEVLVAGWGRSARLKEIVTFEGTADRAREGDAVTLTFETDIDIARGDLLADPREPPECVDQFAAHVIWMSDQPLVPGRSYLLKIGTRTVPATITALKHRIDVETLAHLADRRHGLNRDVGFTDADRVENIRRVGEVAKLMAEAGLIVICSFISPFRAERRMVRELTGPTAFLEVFVDTPLEECIRRDPKGLYAKAKAGRLEHFTGLDSAYEPPEASEIRT